MNMRVLWAVFCPFSYALLLRIIVVISRMSETIIQHQKQALIDTIKEAQKKEIQRLKRLSIATKTEVKQLSDRYDRERHLEQEKIEHLRADLMTLHKKRSEGTLNIAADERREAQKELYRLNNTQYQTAVSRFFGLESLEDVLFHGDVTKRFEKHDQRFQLNISKVSYNPMDDIRKVSMRIVKCALYTMSSIIRV